jgi:hypothetical protein
MVPLATPPASDRPVPVTTSFWSPDSQTAVVDETEVRTQSELSKKLLISTLGLYWNVGIAGS